MLSFLLVVFYFCTNQALKVVYDGPQLDPAQQILMIQIGGLSADTNSVTVHFSEFEIPADAIVVVSSGKENHNYEGWHHGAFQALSLDSNKAFIHLELSSPWDSTKHRVVVDYVYTSTSEDMRRRMAACHQWHDVEPIACADNGQKFVAQAVVKLFKPSTNGLCSGFFFGAWNRVMTNNHCVVSREDAQNWEIHVNYQKNSCSGSSNAPMFKIQVRDLVYSHNGYDAALISLDYDCTDDFPYYILNPYDEIDSLTFPKKGSGSDELKEGDKVYMIHHSSGKEKMITRNEGNQECKIIAFSGNSIITNCDMVGGASGSPLFRASDHRLIGLNKATDCQYTWSSGSGDQHVAEVGENSSWSTLFKSIWDNMKQTQFKCCARFSEDANQQGFQWRVCDDLPHVPNSLNDKFSSLVLTPNCKAYVWNDAHFGGAGTSYTSGSSGGVTNQLMYNDAMSSVRFIRTNSCWVDFYQHSNFVGTKTRFTDDQAVLYKWNDSWSSLKVKPGCSVTVYHDIHHRNYIATYTGPKSSLSQNDCISSFKISESTVGVFARRNLRRRLLDAESNEKFI